MKKVINAYLSKGESVIDGKNIKWDNVVLEVVTDNYINNNQMNETPIFGGKFEKIKISRENFVKLYTNDIKDLAGKDIELFYDSARKPIELRINK